MTARNSHIRRGDNPDITEERVKATFDTEALSAIIYGSSEKLNRRRQITKYVEDHPELHDPYPTDFMPREMKLENVARKALLWMEHAEKATDVNSSDEGFHLGSLITGIDGHPLAIHLIMAIPALLNNADEDQLEEWLPKAISRQFIATYAQTELGHGTNLGKLETTATFDPKTQEWVIHSPTITATKWWPGNLGKSSNYTVLMAQLITNGKNYGTHPFFIQIRDEDTHKPLPGITLGDIGPKFGINANDNGFMKFNNYRVKRRAMLMKNAKVLPDGTYVPPKHPKIGYSAMIYVRAAVVGLMSLHMAQAATIGIRYSVIRRQGEITKGAGEVKILDYQTQQYRLFPQLARAFAFRVAGVHALTMYNTIMQQVHSGNTDALADLHALSSGLKAVATYQAALGIEQCRFACGGHGYSLASGIPQIYSVAVGGCTYEGENMVLLLQMARYLRKRAAEMTNGKGPAETPTPLAAYLFQRSPSHSAIGTPSHAPTGELEGVLQTFEHLSRRLVLAAYGKLQKLEKRGISTDIALNQCAVEWRRASHAHTRVALARIVIEILNKATDKSVREVLEDIVRLYVYYEVGECAAEVLEDGFVDASQVEFARQQVLDALEKIRPNAVSLVDAFDLSDRELNSVLGRRDGNVYENMLKWAQSSPLNKNDVLPFHHKYLGKMMNDAKKASKL